VNRAPLATSRALDSRARRREGRVEGLRARRAHGVRSRETRATRIGSNERENHSSFECVEGVEEDDT
jgi:hypothetical protein